MMIVVPQVWLTAEVGDQRIQLVVPEPQLGAILDVLRFNKARSVSYAAEPFGEAAVHPIGTYVSSTSTVAG